MARADRTPNVQVNQRGDFVALGNSLGQDCRASVPVPDVGDIGNCGTNTGDSAPDVYWRSDDENGTALADVSISPTQAQSTAMLVLPAGAVVTNAYLYWAGEASTAGSAGKTATIARPGVESLPVTADESWTVTHSSQHFFQSFRDVSSFVREHAAGPYRVSGIATRDFRNVTRDVTFVAWSLIVFYRLESDPPRNLAIFHGLDTVSSAIGSVPATLSGFLVPSAAGFDAKLGVVAYEGDAGGSGDGLRFGRTLPLGEADRLSDALNPINNFFNSTRSYLGSAVSNAGDLPQLKGTHASMSGYDLDVVDVSDRLQPGDTTAYLAATSTNDVYFLGAFITSISTFNPDFATSTKKVEDLNGGTARPGDVLRYTIEVKNTGNDTAIDTILRDPLPVGVSYDPGTIKITQGPNAGTKTDAVDTDQAEYLPATRTIVVRLGTGANALNGGSLAVDESTTVQFDVVVEDGFAGLIPNVAEIAASGEKGSPNGKTPTIGNGIDPGSAVIVLVDECDASSPCTNPLKPLCYEDPQPSICVQCLADDDCAGSTPVCNQNHTCEACTDDDDCPDPAEPICGSSGACVQCTLTDMTLCGGTTPVCDDDAGVCEPCATDADCTDSDPACMESGACGECSKTNTAACEGLVPVCNHEHGVCVPCATDADCPELTPACLESGACVECSDTNQTACGELTPVCDLATWTCEPCQEDSECPAQMPLCLSSGKCVECEDATQCPTNAPVCQLPDGICVNCDTNEAGECVECTADADCGELTSGVVCNGTTCVPGCRGTNGNTCVSEDWVCTSVDNTIGECEEATMGTGGSGGDGGSSGSGGSSKNPPADGEGWVEGGGISCGVSGSRNDGIGMAVLPLLLGLLGIRRNRR